MASAALIQPGDDELQLARTHGMLRISTAVTGTYVIGEAFGWFPSFLAPLLAAVILSGLPAALPFKAGIALIAMMSLSAYFAYILASLLLLTPIILFGVIGVIIFICFGMLASGKGQLPITLLLISIATIPIITLVAPQQAAAMPKSFTQAIMLAVAAVWVVHAFWTRTLPPGQAAAPARGLPAHRLALAGTLIVLPIMLVYLMYGITDALPVLMTTIFLVINFDVRRGAQQGLAMLLGNFVGGIIAMIAYRLLVVAPNLWTLALLIFVITAILAARILKGGPQGAVSLLTLNQSLIILGLAIAQGTSNSGLWLTRLFQFAIACAFAVAMMTLVFRSPRSLR